MENLLVVFGPCDITPLIPTIARPQNTITNLSLL